MKKHPLSWLNKELQDEVRKVFEPRYKRKLTDDEVIIIANNLVNLMETYAKFRWKKDHGK